MKRIIGVVISLILASLGGVTVFFIGCFGYIFVDRDHDPWWLFIIAVWTIIGFAFYFYSWIVFKKVL